MPDPTAHPSHPPVHLRVLGEFGLHVREHPVAVRPAQQRLLAFLALHRRPVSRGTLSQRLWGPVDERHGAAALRSNLWRLPKPAGRTLVAASPSHVSLSDSVVVDLWEREQATAEHRAADEPHTRWTDDLLPGWSEDWLVVEQESYRQRRLHVLDDLSGALCEAEQYSSALDAALAAVQADPLRESAHRRVVSVHLAEGNPSEALRAYHAYRRLLASELGLPPSPAIREQVAPLLGRPLETRRR
jgi:DNA-binding SARP family transcriptional activator